MTIAKHLTLSIKRFLAGKLCSLDLPVSVDNWIIDLISDRYQRIKLADDCFSEWRKVPSGVPQGTKLGPWFFLNVINDLTIHDECLWKFVDDTTISETIAPYNISHLQSFVDKTMHWSTLNKFQLNSDKCKELRVSFAKTKRQFFPLYG